MKNKKLWLVLLASLILCGCVSGILFTGASAEETVVLYAVGDLQVSGATQVESIQDALADLEKNNRKWSADTTAEIRICGSDHSGGAQNGVIFGQVTIWREDGTKLPITIRGVDTAEPKDAYIYLDAKGGWYACANDYTFVNLTLPVADQETFFFAGSGNVTVIDCAFGVNGKLTVETVFDRTSTYQNAKAAAEYIALDAANLITPDVGRIPCGDAWQAVRTSAEYMATGTVKTDKNGDSYVDKDLTGADGTAYGDYSHAGNTGGGQYLNACVYYEAIFGLECKDNPWRPTSYELDESLVPVLQKAAHDAVVAVYGEDHFKNPIDYDVNDDEVINLLMVGSSSSYYMRDELHFMAAEVGITLRVVHAYSSGIKMNTQWSWANNGTGSWTVYTEWDGQTSKGVEKQKFTDFINQYPWDVIVTYQTGGSFNKKNLGEGYSEETVALALNSIATADEFINYMYSYNENSNANARYFWFQTVGAPVGAPGPGDGSKGWFFGDNCTDAVYAGWTEADLERYSENGKLVSSITLGDGTSYNGNVSAVGYLTTAPAETYTDATAKAVEFINSAGYDSYGIPEVLPVDTMGVLVIDGATVGGPQVHRGHSPASAEIRVKKGATDQITLCNDDITPRYCDASVRFTGGNVASVDLLYGSQILGNITFYMDESDGEALIGGMLRMAFTDNSVSGDITIDARGGTIGGSVYAGGGAGGTVYNSFSNCTLKGDFCGVRSEKTSHIVNTLKNCTVDGVYYGGHFTNFALTVVENHIEDTVFNGLFYGGSRKAYKISGANISIGGVKEKVSVYNEISGSTFNQNFYGGSEGAATIGSPIRNDLGAGNTFKANFYGGSVAGTNAKIVNNIGESTFEADLFAAMPGGTATSVNTIIDGATVNGIYYGGSEGTTETCTTGTIVNEVRNGTFVGWFYGGAKGASVSVTSVENIVSGGTFNGRFYASGLSPLSGNVTNRISGDTVFEDNFYGSTAEITVGNVTTEISGNPTFKASFNAMGHDKNTAGSDGKTLTTVISGGTFEANSHLSGQIPRNRVTTITVTDGVFNGAAFFGSYSGSAKEIHATIEGGTFNKTVYGGSNSDSTTVGDIYMVVKGGTFNSDFYGGSYGYDSDAEKRAKTSVGSITNEILGGTFVADFYAGSRYGSVGAITNTINGAEIGGSLFCGNNSGTMQGKIKTTIYDCSVETYVYIAGNGTVCEPENFDEQYLVECEILGGTFKGVWGGGSASSETEITTCDILVVVRGGTFKPYSTSDSKQNALSTSGRNKKHVGDVDLFIYGGTFNGEVLAGAFPQGSSDKYKHDDEGTHTVTIYGGTFNKPIYAASKWGSVTEGKVVLNPTESNININSTMLVRDDVADTQKFEIVGGDYEIVLGENAEIEATAVSGDVKFGQSGSWEKKVYVTLPEENTAKVSVTGPHCFDKIGTSVVAVKGGLQLAGATMILTDRIQVRALFDKASVDAVENFTFSFNLGETVVASGDKSNLELWGEDYYCIVLSKVGAKEFQTDIVFTGSDLVWGNEFSIKELAEMAEIAWAGNEIDVYLAKALQNFAVVVADPDAELPYTLTPDLSKLEDFKASGTVYDNTCFDVTGKGLVMGNAAGIRIYGTSETDITDALTVKVNGKDVTDKAVIAAGESAGEYTIDLYVNAKDMSSPLNIVIMEKESGKICLDLTDRVDAVAASYTSDHENYATVQQLLVYIQAAVAYSNK